jgi:hypothetical protein
MIRGDARIECLKPAVRGAPPAAPAASVAWLRRDQIPQAPASMIAFSLSYSDLQLSFRVHTEQWLSELEKPARLRRGDEPHPGPFAHGLEVDSNGRGKRGPW